ncbi:MAG: transposase [Flavobacteriales bacterium]|nr:transposase [Flavobacteriales bacterium]
MSGGLHRWLRALQHAAPTLLPCRRGALERSSGSSVRGRTQASHQADKSLKTLLHMSGLVRVREPGELRQYYERKRAGRQRSPS